MYNLVLIVRAHEEGIEKYVSHQKKRPVVFLADRTKTATFDPVSKLSRDKPG